MPELETEKQLRVKIASMDADRGLAKEQLDRERLIRVSGEVIKTITSPQFVERMKQARFAADAGEGMDSAAKLLSINGLRDAGVDIPEDFRLTSRVFEDKIEGFKLDLKSGPLGGVGDVLGWGACAGGGGLTFCGCGGFSTLTE